jgi:hypothetical protein
MKLPTTAHTTRPWRVHQIAPDFEVEDVWLLRTPGGPDDFRHLVAQFDGGDFPEGAPLVVRFLWEARWTIGRWFGWDRDGSGLGARVASLRERLPADLRDGPRGPALDGVPFRPLYLLDDEWAAEIANRTVHAVLHLAWVPDGAGGYRGQMAVLVKPNGRLGRCYMAAIKPFRYWFVYPALVGQIEREWRSTAAD